MTKYFLSRRKKTRRPQISNPLNFQHVGTGAVDFRTSIQDLPRSAPSFRPLELSIYEPSNRVSPLLPYFIGPNPDLALPQPVRTRDTFDDDGTTLHSRSQSSLSFHIPRRPVGDGASYLSASNSDDVPPRIPPRAKTRPRAYTSPSVEAIVERIASAIIEKDILDAEIHSIKSRASICLSRPSTSYDPGKSCPVALLPQIGDTDLYSDEPVPAFPLVPPTAPSFAERVSIDRPRTAPSTKSAFLPPPPPPQAAPVPAPPPRRTRPRPPPFPERRSSFKAPQWKPNQASRSASAPEPPPKQAVRASAFHSHPPYASPKILDNSIDVSVPLAPPLPLILRPPLRKKKSFSRVSDWLFPADSDQDHHTTTTPSSGGGAPFFAVAHRRHLSIDSVTNAPRALTPKEGYYQTLPPSALFSGPRRRSFDSASELSRPLSGSVYSTDDEEQTAYGGTNTVATSTQWSPGSTPPEEVRRQAESWRQNEAGLSFAMSVADRVGALGVGAGSHISGSERAGSPEGLNADDEVRVQRRRGPKAGLAPLQGPRPTSVGVAF